MDEYMEWIEKRNISKQYALIATEYKLNELKEDLKTMSAVNGFHPHVEGYIAGCIRVHTQIKEVLNKMKS